MSLAVIRKYAKRIKLVVSLYEQWLSYKRLLDSKPAHDVESTEIKRVMNLSISYIYLAGVVGDIAEFGTQTGRTARILAQGIHSIRKWESILPKKNLLLFDSFEGLPEIIADADKNHPWVVFGGWRQGSFKGLTPDELLKVVSSEGLAKARLRLYKGWFAETIFRLPDNTKLALLHVDGDLYQSAIDVLYGCLSRGFISKGAVILFDNWNMAAASSEFGERRAWNEMVLKYQIQYSDGGDYSWHAHRFIIHSYKCKVKEC